MDVDRLDWEKLNGLIPTIAQDWQTGRVLMLGFVNDAALKKTLETRRVTFWSRSRQVLWTKGETSGNYLDLKEVRSDCDGDTLLLLVAPQGPVCHRGTVTCFGADHEFVALEFLGCLEQLIQSRRQQMPGDSYTTKLFSRGLQGIAKKVGEEAVEVVLSASEEKKRSVEEMADLFYHSLVFLAQREVPLSAVMAELRERHLKPAAKA